MVRILEFTKMRLCSINVSCIRLLFIVGSPRPFCQVKVFLHNSSSCLDSIFYQKRFRDSNAFQNRIVGSCFMKLLFYIFLSDRWFLATATAPTWTSDRTSAKGFTTGNIVPGTTGRFYWRGTHRY